VRQPAHTPKAVPAVLGIADSMTVRYSKDPHILRLDIGGSLSAIPSTNRRIIARGRLIRDPKAQRTLNDLAALYHEETAGMEVGFAKEPVHITFVCGERYSKVGHKIGRWDSHNLPKMLCDWLETVGVIQDDCRAEVLVVKRKEYFNDAAPHTTIIIQPYELVAERLRSFVHGVYEDTALIRPT
jgi:Holliday junction resolvase RusA-like endonuclease